MTEPSEKNDAAAYGDTRRFWVTLYKNTEFICFAEDPAISKYKSSENGDHVSIHINRNNAKSRFTIPLTNWTTQELNAFRKFVNDACDLAMETVKQRDAEAQRRLEEEGDDSLSRLYRPVPSIFRKARTGGEHRRLIPQRPGWASKVDKPTPEPDPDAE